MATKVAASARVCVLPRTFAGVVTVVAIGLLAIGACKSKREASPADEWPKELQEELRASKPSAAEIDAVRTQGHKAPAAKTKPPAPKPRDSAAERMDTCDDLDPARVHLWGLASVRYPLGDNRSPNAVAIDVADTTRRRTCFHVSNGAAFPKVRPTDRALMYRATSRDDDGGAGLFRYDADLPERQAMMPTPGCYGAGISAFHIRPDTGDHYFNCKKKGTCRHATPLRLNGAKACLDGPWFDKTGRELTQRAVFAVGNHGELLAQGDGFANLAVYEPNTGVTKDLSYHGDPLLDDEMRFLAARARPGGFWVVLGRWGGRRRRVSVDATGLAKVDGEYPIDHETVGWVRAGKVANSWALDAQGALYEDVGTAVVRTEVNGTAKAVYQLAEPPGRRSEVYGGISAWLVTGP